MKRMKLIAAAIIVAATLVGGRAFTAHHDTVPTVASLLANTKLVQHVRLPPSKPHDHPGRVSNMAQNDRYPITSCPWCQLRLLYPVCGGNVPG